MARKLDKDLRRLTSLEDAVRSRGQHLARLSAGLLFLAIAGLIADAFVGTDSHWSIIVIAAMVSALRSCACFTTPWMSKAIYDQP